MPIEQSSIRTPKPPNNETNQPRKPPKKSDLNAVSWRRRISKITHIKIQAEYQHIYDSKGILGKIDFWWRRFPSAFRRNSDKPSLGVSRWLTGWNSDGFPVRNSPLIDPSVFSSLSLMPNLSQFPPISILSLQSHSDSIPSNLCLNLSEFSTFHYARGRLC